MTEEERLRWNQMCKAEENREIIEELENIKEILIEECVYLPFCYKINKIVNERIAELKGEKE